MCKKTVLKTLSGNPAKWSNTLKQFVDKNLKIIPSSSTIGMASASLSTQSKGYCTVFPKLVDDTYEKVRFHVQDGLCIDIILGTDFQEQHESVTITFVAANLLLVLQPWIPWTKIHHHYLQSRKYSKVGQDFIYSEVKRLAETGITESSNSLWRAQVLVVNEISKRIEWLSDTQRHKLSTFNLIPYTR